MYKKATELCILNKQIVWHKNCISVRLKKKMVPSLSVTLSSLANVAIRELGRVFPGTLLYQFCNFS